MTAEAYRTSVDIAAGVAALDGFASLVGRELRCGRASHRPPWRVRPTCVRTQISSRSNSTKPPMGTPGCPRVLFWRLDEMTCYNNKASLAEQSPEVTV